MSDLSPTSVIASNAASARCHAAPALCVRAEEGVIRVDTGRENEEAVSDDVGRHPSRLHLPEHRLRPLPLPARVCRTR